MSASSASTLSVALSGGASFLARAVWVRCRGVQRQQEGRGEIEGSVWPATRVGVGGGLHPAPSDCTLLHAMSPASVSPQHTLLQVCVVRPRPAHACAAAALSAAAAHAQLTMALCTLPATAKPQNWRTCLSRCADTVKLLYTQHVPAPAATAWLAVWVLLLLLQEPWGAWKVRALPSHPQAGRHQSRRLPLPLLLPCCPQAVNATGHRDTGG